MPVPQHQILMGVGIASICLTGLVRHRWLLTRTSKGRSLVQRFGAATARNLIWLLCVLGVAFGSLLASGILRPVAW